MTKRPAATDLADEPVAASSLSAAIIPMVAAGEVGDAQLRVDVQLCLLDAMTDCLPIRRDEIGAGTIPSSPPIGSDSQGWGSCLARFGEYLRALRPFYAFYVHKPVYTVDTLNSKFPEIVSYLKKRVLAQYAGTEP